AAGEAERIGRIGDELRGAVEAGVVLAGAADVREVDAIPGRGRRARFVHERADAARGAARVAFEVGDLVEHRGPVQDALIRGVLLRERSVERSRLARAR